MWYKETPYEYHMRKVNKYINGEFRSESPEMPRSIPPKRVSSGSQIPGFTPSTLRIRGHEHRFETRTKVTWQSAAPTKIGTTRSTKKTAGKN